MPALHRTRQGLDTNIIGTAVAAKGDVFNLFISRQFTLFLHGYACRLRARYGRAGIFKRTVDKGIVPRRVRIQAGRYLQASGRGTNDRMVFLF